ncbi:electron transfer flavoprotein-ubiquinone oxidoreductase-domain-containing protein [Ilyonectria sp. MPI-CAGE-AT-0026]|nr:electron transfer flavoprotein-ubiquinone oxidoreductase-domain-containing protein [Ilyonectria sp. MPI-CAGE-AT-0026]
MTDGCLDAWITPDHAATLPADKVPKIEYDKPDGKITFDILTSVSRTGTNHEEDQPVHLQVKDWDQHTAKTYPPFKGVENRFCPTGVYEYVEDESKPPGVRFQINAQNCIHCNICDIKAPHQDINCDYLRPLTSLSVPTPIMEGIQTHPSNAAQAKAFTAPGSLSFPGATNKLTPPPAGTGDAAQRPAPHGQQAANGNVTN